MAPLRILSFDIECAGRKGVFPDPTVDPVIQIASMVTRQGEMTPFVKNIFTLGSCSHIVGCHVMSYDSELEMLEAWAAFVQRVDPDVVIGYNISNFDFPYLLDRARALRSSSFAYLSREKSAFLILTQTRARRPRRRTFRPRRTAHATRSTPSSRGGCSSTCSRSCSATTSCAAIRSTRCRLSSSVRTTSHSRGAKGGRTPLAYYRAAELGA